MHYSLHKSNVDFQETLQMRICRISGYGVQSDLNKDKAKTLKVHLIFGHWRESELPGKRKRIVLAHILAGVSQNTPNPGDNKSSLVESLTGEKRTLKAWR